MKAGDFIIYYAPKFVMNEKAPCQQFVAVGQIKSDAVYQGEMFPGFKPFRKEAIFFKGL